MIFTIVFKVTLLIIIVLMIRMKNLIKYLILFLDGESQKKLNLITSKK